MALTLPISQCVDFQRRVFFFSSVHYNQFSYEIELPLIHSIQWKANKTKFHNIMICPFLHRTHSLDRWNLVRMKICMPSTNFFLWCAHAHVHVHVCFCSIFQRNKINTKKSWYNDITTIPYIMRNNKAAAAEKTKFFGC